MNRISIYLGDSIISKNHHVESSLDAVLALIKEGSNPEWKALAAKANATYGTDQYSDNKGALPAIMFNGLFPSGRKHSDLQEPSGLMVLDIDAPKDESLPWDLNAVTNILKLSPYVYAMFLSPSNNGLKMLVKIPKPVSTLEFSARFEAAKEYYRGILGEYKESFDKSSSNVSRLCYYNYDPNLHVNVAAQIFDKKVEKSVVKRDYVAVSTDRTTSDVIEKLLIRKVESLASNIANAPEGQRHATINEMCVTMGGYAAEYAAIDHSFLLETLIDAALSLPDRATDSKIIQQVTSGFEKGKETPCAFGTPEIIKASRPERWDEIFNIFHLFNQNRICSKKGSEDVVCFGEDCNERGIPFEDAVLFASKKRKMAIKGDELEDLIKEGYDNTVANSVTSVVHSDTVLTVAMSVHNWIQKKNLSYDMFKSRLYIDGKPMNADAMLLFAAEEMKIKKMTIQQVKSAIAGIDLEHVSKIVPAENFLNKADEWDGEDYVEILFECIDLKYPQYKEWYKSMFKKHLIRGVHQILEGTPLRQYVFSFTGSGEQNSGKTTFCEWMGNYESVAEISADGKMKEMDEAAAMCSKAVAFFDEFKGFGLEAQDYIKSTITKSIYRYIPKYVTDFIEIKRTALLFATTNNQRYLVDDVNTRYLNCAVIRFDWEKYVELIGKSPMNLWAQAIYAYDSLGKDGGVLTAEEVETQNEINKELHQKETVSDSILESVLRPHSDSDEYEHYISTGDLVALIKRRTGGTYMKLQFVVQALKNMGIYDQSRPHVEHHGQRKMYKVCFNDIGIIIGHCRDSGGSVTSQIYSRKTGSREKVKPLITSLTY